MPWYDMFRVAKFKQELAELTQRYETLQSKCKRMQASFKQKYADLKRQMEAVKATEAYGVKKSIQELRSEQESVDATLTLLKAEVEAKKSQIIQLDETILMQEFGIYEPQYDLKDSSLFKSRLDKIRDEQKQMVKDREAATSDVDWSIGGSRAEGKKMVRDYVRLILRAFNNECDATISKAKYNNVDSLEKKINKAAETLNKLGDRMSISITARYINLKVQELYLAYEYELKKQEEKEEQRLIKEQMREEAKALKEIEKAKEKLQ